jgi:hypothetical protein
MTTVIVAFISFVGGLSSPWPTSKTSPGVVAVAWCGEPAKDVQTTYVMPVKTVAYAKPDEGAAVVNTFPAFAIAIVCEAVEGWLLVEPGTIDAATKESGWIKADKEYLSPSEVIVGVMRRSAVEKNPWAKQVKLDKLRSHTARGLVVAMPHWTRVRRRQRLA